MERGADARSVDHRAQRRFAGALDAHGALCALDGRLLDVARQLADDAKDVEHSKSPFFTVTVGRLAFAVGDTATALDCARRVLESAGVDAVSTCAALDLQGRVLDLAGDATMPQRRGADSNRSPPKPA